MRRPAVFRKALREAAQLDLVTAIKGSAEHTFAALRAYRASKAALGAALDALVWSQFSKDSSELAFTVVTMSSWCAFQGCMEQH